MKLQQHYIFMSSIRLWKKKYSFIIKTIYIRFKMQRCVVRKIKLVN